MTDDSVKQRYLLGVGNCLKGDDGIGVRLVEYIIDSDLDKGFSAVEVGNDGMSLLAHLAEGPARVVIADCAVMGADPGDWRIMHPSELLSRKVTGRISTHDGDVMKVLAAAERLGYSLDNVMILGIEPESTDLEIAISKSLSDRIAEYAIAAGEALAA